MGDQLVDVVNELALLWEVSREYGRAADRFLLAAQNASGVCPSRGRRVK